MVAANAAMGSGKVTKCCEVATGTAFGRVAVLRMLRMLRMRR